MKKQALLSILICLALPVAAAHHLSAVEKPWYDIRWMLSAPHAPTFRVLDTESSLGPYAVQSKTLTLQDLVRMHGHPCDGLVLAACALHFGLPKLYPDGIVDRTDTGIITNNSPCFGDVGEYLTGGRIRFGTQKIDPTMKNEFIVYRFSTGKAIKISLKPGVFPKALTTTEAILRNGRKNLELVKRCQALQLGWIRRLLNTAPEELFDIRELPEFRWVADKYEHTGERGDVRMKSIARKRPLSVANTELQNKQSREDSK